MRQIRDVAHGERERVGEGGSIEVVTGLAEDDADDDVGDGRGPHVADVNGDASARVVIGQVVREPVDNLLDARAVLDNAAAAEHRRQSLAAGAVQCGWTGGSNRVGHIKLVGKEFELVDRLVVGVHHFIVGWVIDMEFVGVDAYDRAYMYQSAKKNTSGCELDLPYFLCMRLISNVNCPPPFFTVSKYVSYHCVAAAIFGPGKLASG